MTPRSLVLCLILALFNLAAWFYSLLWLPDASFSKGAALMAYCLGLRHALDADHIAAIDNATRKLMSDGRSPHFAGLMFALGHSTIVLTGALLITHGVRLHGSLTAYALPIVFLLGIAVANLGTLLGAWRWSPAIQLIGLVRTSAHLYPIGAVFGLAFDTATEIGVLNLSVVTAPLGLALGQTLCLPVLFAAGMATADSLDNLLMIQLFRTSNKNSRRPRQYMTTMTGLSVAAALTVGAIEALDLVRLRWSLNGPVWTFIHSSNENLPLIGSIMVGLFVISALILSGGRRVMAYR